MSLLDNRVQDVIKSTLTFDEWKKVDKMSLPRVGEWWYVNLDGKDLQKRKVTDITQNTIEISYYYNPLGPSRFGGQVTEIKKRYEHGTIKFVEKCNVQD